MIMGSFLEKRRAFIINNCIESYHNQLNSYYFGHTGDIGADRMIYVLSQAASLTINKILYTLHLVQKISGKEKEKKGGRQC